MYCMKCGRAIADDKVFCAACSAAPLPVAPVTVAQPAKRVKKTVKKKEKPPINYKPICLALSVALVLLAVLFALLVHISLKRSRDFDQREKNLKNKEAWVAIMENDLRKKTAENDELKAELEQVKSELAEALAKLKK